MVEEYIKFQSSPYLLEVLEDKKSLQHAEEVLLESMHLDAIGILTLFYSIASALEDMIANDKPELVVSFLKEKGELISKYKSEFLLHFIDEHQSVLMSLNSELITSLKKNIFEHLPNWMTHLEQNKQHFSKVTFHNSAPLSSSIWESQEISDVKKRSEKLMKEKRHLLEVRSDTLELSTTQSHIKEWIVLPTSPQEMLQLVSKDVVLEIIQILDRFSQVFSTINFFHTTNRHSFHSILAHHKILSPIEGAKTTIQVIGADQLLLKQNTGKSVFVGTTPQLSYALLASPEDYPYILVIDPLKHSNFLKIELPGEKIEPNLGKSDFKLPLYVPTHCVSTVLTLKENMQQLTEEIRATMPSAFTCSLEASIVLFQYKKRVEVIAAKQGITPVEVWQALLTKGKVELPFSDAPLGFEPK